MNWDDNDHSQHGRGDEGGPFDSGCNCVNSDAISVCAEAGCGFCIAALEMRAR